MEILQDTIIKLIVRQGSDNERKAITLTSGEPGYTTDTKRLYVGDGTKLGGNVTGNLYISDFVGNPGIPPLNSVVGDLAFNTTTRKLYKSNVAGSNFLGNWGQVGGVYVSGDNKINISNTNVITLCALSGGSLDPSLVQYPIVLSAGKIALPPLSAGTVSENLVQYPIVLSAGKISLPPLSAGTVSENLVSFPIVLSAGKIALSPLSAGYLTHDTVNAPIFISNGGRISLSAIGANFISSDAVLSPVAMIGGQIGLKPLSAGYVSSDLLQSPLYLSAGKISLSLSSFPLSALGLAVEAPIILNNGAIALSAKIPTDRVSINTVEFSTAFNVTDINDSTILDGVPFNVLDRSVTVDIAPAALLSSLSISSFEGPLVFSSTTKKLGLSAKFPFERVSTNTITASSGLQAYVDGINQGTTPINSLSANIVLQTNQLFINFDGATGTNTYSRGISGIRIGLGTYVFKYGPLPTANIYPFVQLASTNNHKFTSRILGTATVSSLSVFVYDQTAGTPNQPGDLPLFLQINY